MNIIIAIIFAIKNFKIIRNEIFKLNSLFIYLLTGIFVQQFIYTSCFIFPSNFTCIEVLAWYNHIILILREKLE